MLWWIEIHSMSKLFPGTLVEEIQLLCTNCPPFKANGGGFLYLSCCSSAQVSSPFPLFQLLLCFFHILWHNHSLLFSFVILFPAPCPPPHTHLLAFFPITLQRNDMQTLFIATKILKVVSLIYISKIFHWRILQRSNHNCECNVFQHGNRMWLIAFLTIDSAWFPLLKKIKYNNIITYFHCIPDI